MFAFLKKLIHPFYRDPDVIVGNGNGEAYMLRWHVIPRNRWFNIYLHKFLRNDDERAMHDHPWKSLSLLLWGEYIEVTEKGRRHFRCGNVIYRTAEYTHRIELIDDKPCWTLFVTGPRGRQWGFHCPNGWVHWRLFDKVGCD